jgi:hypothetical protein
MTNLYPSSLVMGKTKTISSKVRARERCSFSSLSQYSTGIPRQSNKTREKNKWVSIEKGEVKLSLRTDDMILYLKELTDYIKRTLRSD